MSPETKQKIQLMLLAGIAIAAIRTGYIFYQRRQDNAPAKQETPPLKADYYVIPKKLHPYDLKSAHELTKQPVWVRDGYRFTYYPYTVASKHSDFAHAAGTLGPIEQLDIKDVVTDTPPEKGDERQVMAVFQKEGKSYAFPIGLVEGDNYTIYSDDMLFMQDPMISISTGQRIYGRNFKTRSTAWDESVTGGFRSGDGVAGQSTRRQ